MACANQLSLPSILSTYELYWCFWFALTDFLLIHFSACISQLFINRIKFVFRIAYANSKDQEKTFEWIRCELIDRIKCRWREQLDSWYSVDCIRKLNFCYWKRHMVINTGLHQKVSLAFFTSNSDFFIINRSIYTFWSFNKVMLILVKMISRQHYVKHEKKLTIQQMIWWFTKINKKHSNTKSKGKIKLLFIG